jgi:tetratricopeptide (TPR) repeat protein
MVIDSAMNRPLEGRGVLPTAAGFLLFLGVTLAIYWNVIGGGFVWDDKVFVINNPLIREPGRFSEIWLSREAADYWPLSYSVFWVAWRAFGENPAGYHVCNIVLHAVTAALIWQVLRALGLRYALLAALVFSVHPVNVESVAWLFQIKTTLAAALAFASLLAWMHFVAMPRRHLYVLSVVLFLLSLLAKSTTVTWPFVILGYLWWKRGRLGRKELRLASPFFLIALMLGSIGVLWYERVPLLPSEAVRTDGLLSRLAGAGWAYWFYLGKALVPADLTFIYSRWPIPLTRPLDCVPTAALIAVLLTWWHFRRTAWGRIGLASLGFYLIALVPVLGFVNIYFMRFSLVADHFQYLAIIGVLAPLTELTARALERWRTRATWGLVVPIAVLCTLTVRQNRIYAAEDDIWRDTVRKNPTAWLAWLNLGLSAEGHGRYDEALSDLERSLALKPDNFEAMAQIGQEYYRRGKKEEAVSFLRRALEVNPRAPTAVDLLAAILAKEGHVEQAARLCTGLLEVRPGLPAVQNNCAVYLHALGRKEEALALWRPLAILDPARPLSSHNRTAIGNLAEALRDEGRFDEALIYYKRAAEVGYRPADSLLNCGVIHFNKGELAPAVAELTEAIALDPTNAEAFYVRGLAKAKARQPEESCADMAKAAAMGFDPALAAHASCKR